MAIRGPAAKFNSHQYFRLYGKCFVIYTSRPRRDRGLDVGMRWRHILPRERAKTTPPGKKPSGETADTRYLTRFSWPGSACVTQIIMSVCYIEYLQTCTMPCICHAWSKPGVPKAYKIFSKDTTDQRIFQKQVVKWIMTIMATCM